MEQRGAGQKKSKVKVGRQGKTMSKRKKFVLQDI
jgi:hypothetical protein